MGSLASPLVTHRNKEKSADLNVRNVVLGDILFKAWYPSFYPEELIGRELERLFVCQWCFKYSKDLMPYLAHTKVCPLKDEGPPGRPIYSRDLHAIYEVDGEEHQLFAQNLSLFAKLFLDNKSIFFDVASFNYYLLVHTPNCTSSHHPQIVGFFSKEKMSWDNNNLACILVFPPWQRKGLGKILMGVSYELSRRENRLGGPEKPLSELGRKGYMRFWEARVARAILELKSKQTLSVGEISEASWVLPEDVVGTLKDMGVLTASKRADGAAVISKARLRESILKKGLDVTPPVSEEGFLDEWIPGPEKDENSGSEYFKNACSGKSEVCLEDGQYPDQNNADKRKEGCLGSIELKDEDPQYVGILLRFFYAHDCHIDDNEKPTLMAHACVYAIADKYGVGLLKDVRDADIPDFIAAIEVVCTSTLGSDRGLRDFIKPKLIEFRQQLRDSDHFMALFVSDLGEGEFAVKVLDTWTGLSAPRTLAASALRILARNQRYLVIR